MTFEGDEDAYTPSALPKNCTLDVKSTMLDTVSVNLLNFECIPLN